MGNIHQATKNTEAEVTQKETTYDSSPTEANKRNLCTAQQKFNEKLEIKELFGKQKANVKWLAKGDKNTRFFDQTLQQKKQRLHIHRLGNEDGDWITDPEEIQKEAIFDFKSRLNGDHLSEGILLWMIFL